jgi:flagellar hook assembly protein FlgD
VVPAVLSSNIFHPSTGQPLTISLLPTADGRVTVRVFNISGEKVREPYAADVAAGAWVQCYWDGRNEAGESAGAGVYIVSVQGAGLKRLMKVILLK